MVDRPLNFHSHQIYTLAKCYTHTDWHECLLLLATKSIELLKIVCDFMHPCIKIKFVSGWLSQYFRREPFTLYEIPYECLYGFESMLVLYAVIPCATYPSVYLCVIMNQILHTTDLHNAFSLHALRTFRALAAIIHASLIIN